MIPTRLFRSTMLAAALAISAFAADVTGKWKTSFTTPDGTTRENILNLKADGNKLTGTLESQRGNAEIQEGKIDGDSISFVVVRNFQGNEVKVTYKGAVSGDEIKLKMGFGEREVEMTAKRVK
jgi:hypothetical protein